MDLRTTVVTLPGGLVSDGRWIRRVGLRPLTGSEEDWLAESRDVPNAAKVTKLLIDCVVSVEETTVNSGVTRRMLVGDRDFLILQLRAATLGDRIQAVLSCAACRQPIDVDFPISGMTIEPRPQTSERYSVELNGRQVCFRLPSGEDQEAVLGLDLEKAADALLGLCVVDDGGAALTADEREALAAEMERLAPAVDLELELECPECGHSFIAPFDTTAFFFDEMRVNHERLMREFHTLAFYYHWSEKEILSLRRDRRRAYLNILSEALRRE